MRRYLLPLLLAATGLRAQDLPAHDLVLFRVGASAQDRPVLLDPVRLTDRAAYDNQPAFSEDGALLWYTAQAEEGTDIVELDLASGERRALTPGPEAEFSPRPTPDGRSVSAVRVELPDSVQRLWRFGRDGRKARPVMHDVEAVGYYAWLADGHVACFILGEGDRHTLQVGHAAKQRLDVVAAGIGRSLVTLPDGSLAFSDPAAGLIRRFDPASRRTEDLAPLLEARDFTADPRGRLWMGVAGRLYVFDPAGDRRWHFACDVSSVVPAEWRLGSFDRLVTDPTGTRAVLVFPRLDD